MRETFLGECWTQSKPAAEQYGLRHIRGHRSNGLAVEPGLIYFGSPGSSGYQAINLVYHFGAAQIVLLGYDMGVNGKTHWFGDHPAPLQQKSPFNGWIETFYSLARDLEVEGVELINCTRETALTCVERRLLEAVT